jgi:hypothetical protein
MGAAMVYLIIGVVLMVVAVLGLAVAEIVLFRRQKALRENYHERLGE